MVGILANNYLALFLERVYLLVLSAYDWIGILLYQSCVLPFLRRVSSKAMCNTVNNLAGYNIFILI